MTMKLNQITDPAWLKYRDAILTVEKYIKAALKTSFQLNEYVPNTHIALILVEVIELLEFEMMFFPKLTKDRLIIDEFYKYIYKDYDPNVLFAHQEKRTVHELYQKLREKDDYYRNICKLLIIRNEREWMLYKTSDSSIASRNESKVRKSEKKAEKALTNVS